MAVATGSGQDSEKRPSSLKTNASDAQPKMVPPNRTSSKKQAVSVRYVRTRVGLGSLPCYVSKCNMLFNNELSVTWF